jgi:hypothetical protein
MAVSMNAVGRARRSVDVILLRIFGASHAQVAEWIGISERHARRIWSQELKWRPYLARFWALRQLEQHYQGVPIYLYELSPFFIGIHGRPLSERAVLELQEQLKRELRRFGLRGPILDAVRRDVEDWAEHVRIGRWA